VATFEPGEGFWSKHEHATDQHEVNTLLMIRYLVRGYDHTGDRGYIEAALRLYEDWREHSSVDTFHSPYTWGEHAVAVRLYSIMALAASISSREDFTAELETILADIHRHARLLSEWGFYSTWSNHGMFQNRALLGMAVIFDFFADSGRLLSIAVDRPLAWIRSKVCRNGVLDEGSAAYQFIVLDLASRVNALLDKAGHPQPDLAEMVRKMAAVARLLVKPNGRLWGFGDTWASGRVQVSLDQLPALERDLLARALRAGDPDTAWHEYAVFPESGYFFFVENQPGNEDDAYLGFDFGVSTRDTHFQDDTGNFELMLRGHCVIEDSGYFGLSAGPIGDYYRSAASHTTIMFTDKLSTRDIAETRLDSFTESPEALEVTASFRTSEGHWFQRTLRYYLDDFVLIVCDRFRRAQGSGASLFFHYAPELDAHVHAGSEHSVVRLSKPDAAFAHHILSQAAPSVTLHRGETDPYLGWISRAQGEKQPRWTAVVRFSEPEGELISVFAAADVDIAPYLHDGTAGLSSGAPSGSGS